MATVECPWCDSDDVVFVQMVGGYHQYECRNCGQIFEAEKASQQED